MNSNWNISWEDTQDPKALNTNPDVYLQYTRDPVRTPFQWNDDFNAGNHRPILFEHVRMHI